jgi:hypothetical protein
MYGTEHNTTMHNYFQIERGTGFILKMADVGYGKL